MKYLSFCRKIVVFHLFTAQNKPQFSIFLGRYHLNMEQKCCRPSNHNKN